MMVKFRSAQYSALSLYVCIVATILTRLTCSAAHYKHIGCYAQYYNHKALPVNLGYIKYGYYKGSMAVKECAAKARKKGYSTFGVYWSQWCYSGPRAYKTYDEHGISTACSMDGTGGYNAIDVYQFTVRPYKHIGCYNEYSSNRALPEHMGYITGDQVVKKCAIAAFNKGYNTFGIQHIGSNYGCYSGPTADSTYNIHGKSQYCSSGEGGSWEEDVYQFTDEILWPQGNFTLLKPSSGCPSDWVDNGWIFQDTVDNVKNNRSSVLHIDGYVAEGYVVRSFCMKTRRTSPEWPAGQYCIYREGKRDPTNMKKGWIRMDNMYKRGSKNKDAVNLISQKTIEDKKNSIRFHFFCQTSGVKSQAIDLPITHPFYLLPYDSTECQQVKWMVASTEWIQYSTRNYGVHSSSWKSGTIPYIKAGTRSKPGVTMYYCYYESCNKTLSDMKGTFQSPRFPDKYPDGQLCSWKIQVPANHTVHVNFTTFSLAVENGNDTDVLEYYTSTRGSLQLVKVYRGRLESFKVHSTSDLMFVFRSNQANSSLGFNAEYHIIPDQELTTGNPTTATTLPSVKQSSSPKTTQFKTTDSSHTSIEDSTTDKLATSEIQPSPSRITASFESNNTLHDAYKDNRGGTGTTILIVIPLVCFILVLVVTIDIIYRCRHRLSSHTKNKEDRLRTDNDQKIAENPMYGRGSLIIPMNYYDNAATYNTNAGQKDEDNDQSYDRLSCNVLPKLDHPEQYDQLNRNQPIKSGHDNGVSLQNDGPVYQTPEGPDSEPVVDDQMYHTIDKEPSSNDLYGRNILYDSVA